jgi:hypothetical protein
MKEKLQLEDFITEEELEAEGYYENEGNFEEPLEIEIQQ